MKIAPGATSSTSHAPPRVLAVVVTSESFQEVLERLTNFLCLALEQVIRRVDHDELFRFLQPAVEAPQPLEGQSSSASP